MKVFRAIGRFLKSILSKIGLVASKIVMKCKEFLQEFIETSKGKIVESLWDLAVECARLVAANPNLLTDEDKRHDFEGAMKETAKAEGKELEDFFRQQGIQFSVSLFNFIREMAVQYIKTK